MIPDTKIFQLKMLARAQVHLAKLLEGKVDSTHGLEHALAVLHHVQRVSTPLLPNQRCAVELAALLHDVDDHKYFPEHTNLENAREILRGLDVSPWIEQKVLEMIGLVSCSSNGNTSSPNKEEWMLYPRYADRLEALGEIGIVRCWLYNQHVGRPLTTPQTPQATTEQELDEIASPERFQKYLQQKKSVSFIDHFYDKLLHIGQMSDHSYFQQESLRRLNIMREYLLKYGQTGDLQIDYLQSLHDNYFY